VKDSKLRLVRYQAIIIGGGHNGLTCAAYLARSGLSVLVLERHESVGGAAISEAPWPGWTVSEASYVCSLLHPDIIEELDLPGFGLFLYRKDPASFTPLLDGRSLLLGTDSEANAREIGAFATDDVAGFRSFGREAERLGSIVFDASCDPNASFERLAGDVRSTFEGPVSSLVERFVRTPVLQATLATDGLIGTFAGPRDPGTGYVLAHHYAGRALGEQGAWGYVRGGMGSISRALAGAATSAGAQIRTGATVSSILVRDRRAAGVVLDDGSEIEADAVLSNADPMTTFLELVPARTLERDFERRVRDWRCDGVSLKVNLALGELPNFVARPARGVAAHHRATIHITPSLDYLQRAKDDAALGRVSAEPMLECFMQTPTDATLAPAGKHLLSVFAQYFPYRLAEGEWTPARRDAAADLVVATLAGYAPNIPNAIEARQVFTPLDLERRFGLRGGHIFHGELVPGQIFEKRFAARTPLAHLYLCGSGAHPGGCVSGIPGLLAARAVVADYSVVRG